MNGSASDPPAQTAFTRRSEFTAGLGAVLPMLIGAIPFGLIYGVLAIKAGIEPWLAVAISSIETCGRFAATL